MRAETGFSDGNGRNARPAPSKAPASPASPHRTRTRSLRLPAWLFDFTFEVQGRLDLVGFPGTAFRGAFGRAFRRLSCTTGVALCRGCPHIDSCTYGLVWEGAGSDARRPYAFDWLSGSARGLVRGDTLSVRVKLFAHAQTMLPYLIRGMREAAQLGIGKQLTPLSLVRAVHLAGGDRPVSLLDSSDAEEVGLSPCDAAPLPVQSDAAEERVRLVFPVPLQLKSAGKLFPGIDLDVLTARLTERLNALGRVYGEGMLVPDYRQLRQAARQARIVAGDVRPVDERRRSVRSARWIPLEGVVGWVVVEGVAPALRAVWECGALVHAGRQATLGCGRFHVERMENSG